MGFNMEKAFEEQESVSYQTEASSPPIMICVHSVTESAKNFFTLTEEEKEAAGICDYKNYPE